MKGTTRTVVGAQGIFFIFVLLITYKIQQRFILLASFSHNIQVCGKGSFASSRPFGIRPAPYLCIRTHRFSWICSQAKSHFGLSPELLIF